MSIKVFTGKGALEKLQGKKSVLSNKSLTRRVRALTGIEGERTTSNQNLYDNVTLSANMADINYLTDFNALENGIFHKIRVWVHLTAVANSVTRIIFFEDTQKVATDLAFGAIIQLQEPFSNYKTGGKVVNPWSVGRKHKNIAGGARCRILKDLFIGQTLTSNTIVTRMFDINLHGRKTNQALEWGCLVISDQANVININLLLDHTILDD